MSAPNKKRGGPREEAAPKQSNCRKNGPLPAFLQDLIACPPQHGSGVHQWLFKVARQLHAHRDEETIVDLLAAAVDDCGRDVPKSEIITAVKNARACAWNPGACSTNAKPVPKWPEVTIENRQAVIARAGNSGLAGIRGMSHCPCTADSSADIYVEALFPGNPLLCCGLDMAHFETAPLESFRGKLSELSLIVPSPMSALLGKRKSDGKDSAHTLDNTGPRHYLVTEFDSGSLDEQAALIGHLRQYGPLVMVLSSGGKSLHAWWNCQGISDNMLVKFMSYAVSLGADPATWTRSQFVRLPGGWRAERQRRQEVFYFDPENGKGQEP